MRWRSGAPSEQLAASGLRVVVEPVDEEAVMDRLVRAMPVADSGATTGPPLLRAPAPARAPAAEQGR